MYRNIFLVVSALLLVSLSILSYFSPVFLWLLAPVLLLTVIGWMDAFQSRRAIRRNFPLIGNFRYMFEAIRPEINQYFVESNSDGVPYSREDRSVVYQRAKNQLDTLPFGTQKNVYESGYEWVNHSLAPVTVKPDDLRVVVGGPDCKQPYSASILNISAMSFGALSKNAIRALSAGAALGGFAHNTGEGGISPYHLKGGADLIWQIGTGYFGCRRPDGGFCEESFRESANLPNVKMIEIKLSQGAKPGHGGILPAAKVTPEIARVRHVPMGEDVNSPPAHSAFSTPVELIHFVSRLRELSGGKPVGIKLCVGKRREFLAICKAMLKEGTGPDFITVDGGEGGTGAAPLEFSNYIGCPLTEGLIFVHNALVGCGLRERVRVIASGKVTTGFGVVKRLALGADMCNASRAMMMALGCIQALRCNTNHCPTGVATQDPGLTSGLVVEDKTKRVKQYHRATVKAAAEIIGAAGIKHPADLRPWHIMRRVTATEIRHYAEIYEYIESESLLKDLVPTSYERAWRAAEAESFARTAAV